MNTPDASRRRKPSKPAHDLSDFKSGKLVIARSALAGAAAMGMSKADIKTALASLDPAYFYKSMPAAQMPGAAMDVYHLPHAGRAIYVKFVRAPSGVYFLTSFKER
ncbi:MAG TPA: type II toxin-antitoxin system MqsR family toxin [Alphaproteobacteria bacterium]|nr:type II toxin-antitoxin system MqsR family toxin [Alphaproteobacteria bacterium]